MTREVSAIDANRVDTCMKLKVVVNVNFPAQLNTTVNFARKVFCVNCTIEEAQTNNIYNAEPKKVNLFIDSKRIWTKEH